MGANFATRGAVMPDKKTVFVAFAIEDVHQRDLLKGQSLHPRSPFEFIDISVKEPYQAEWKEKVRTRIRRSHGVIVLVSKNSTSSAGQKWEIQRAKDEGKKIRGIWAYSSDRTQITGVTTYAWSDANITGFIDSPLTMRKALIVGIDYYKSLERLSGCVHDAHSVRAALERNADGTLNFTNPQLLTATDDMQGVGRVELKDAVRSLFVDDSEIALLYFAGHGYVEDTGGFLCASDCDTGDDGLSLSEVMALANNSPARNKIIVLDSCHSGVVGTTPLAPGIAELKEGVTVLTASTENQYSYETPGGGAGVFTNLFVDALNGAAANLVGAITPGSVYAHIDQSLGPWAQRPMFKTNVKTFVSLREAEPPISLQELQALTIHFPTPDYSFPLDPTYEPERSPEQLADKAIPAPDLEHTVVFRIFAELRECERGASGGCTPHVARSNGRQVLRVDGTGPALLATGRPRSDLDVRINARRGFGIVQRRVDRASRVDRTQAMGTLAAPPPLPMPTQ